jgi:nitronate monooxygenase
MALPAALKGRLRVPLIGAPMLIASDYNLALAQCKAGVIGTFPALSARPAEVLDEWLAHLNAELAAYDKANPSRPSAPYAVNLIVHKTNERLQADLASCLKHRVPIVITALGVQKPVIDAVHSYGGLVFHDVTNIVHARKAASAGVDGLIAVAAGAGGHGGRLSPFALVQEIREWFDGLLILSGAIANGRSVLAAQAMGCDLAYIGSAFIATKEAGAPLAHKQMVVDSSASDIVYTDLFSGVNGNYLKPSIREAGLDPDNLPPRGTPYNTGAKKVWRDIWAAGQGVGAVKSIPSVAEFVDRIDAEYRAAKAALVA